MRWMRIRVAFVATLGLLAGGALGCAEERDPINRVQANALAKSFFVGEDLHSDADNPEFWSQGTVVDVGYGAAQDGLFTSTYAQPVARLKWQITEDLLIGRLSYERIQDSDGKKGVGPSTDQGVIVVAYPIQSHFDIRYEYNPTTGEELNVLVENGSDRPWYDREYFRVDWSKNLNVDSYDYDTLSMLGVYGGVDYEPLDYYVSDPNDPDAPHFDPETGYFDVTNKAFAKPKMIDLSHLGWGIDKFPACYLDNDFFGGSAPSGTCNPVELTIRQSFRRVVDRDYEPVNWDGKRFSAYGAFTVDRSGYARNYGMSDDKWYRFAARYNIWERSHYYADPEKMTGEVKCFVPEKTLSGDDPHRDLDGNGTEDECEEVTKETGVAGSRCDEFKQRCTLPYRLRKEVPQPWYYTKESDPEYFESTDWATHEWDVAMRAAVMSARNAECKATGGDPGACDGQFPMYRGQMDDNWDLIQLSHEVDACRAGKTNDGRNCEAIADQLGSERGVDPGVIAVAKMQQMIMLCHSPVLETDDPACGPAGRTVRMGDLRYHQINVIPTPQTPSPWGIMVDSDDPLTGEKIAASANVWSHVTDLFSQGLVDQMRYLNGELTTDQVTEGTYVKDWAIASEVAGGTGVLPQMSQADLSRRVLGGAGVMPDKMKAVESGEGSIVTKPEFAESLENVKQMVRDVRADALAPSANRPVYEARRQRAAGSQMEAQLTTKAMQQLAGTDKLPVNDAVMNFASPLRGNHPQVQRDIARMKEIALAERGMCIMQATFPSPIGLTSLDKAIQAKFKDAINPRTGAPYGTFADPMSNTKQDQLDRAEVIRHWIAQKAHYSVMAHEMGHSIGLRHNFVSSSDAWGFRPQYWQLRTKNGKVTAACNDLKSEAESENCVGPRYFDQVTANERDQLLTMFMHQSIMEYGGEVTQDFIGLSAYDFAAARMFYGQTVAVHADTDMNADKPLGRAALDKMDGFGGIIGYQYTSNGSANIHYSQLQRTWKMLDAQSCTALTEEQVQRLKPADWDEGRLGKWDPLLDGLIVKVNGEYSKCKTRKVDYMPWQSMRDNGVDFGRRWSSVDATKRTRVPYGFATDRWADLGNVAVYRHDNGADVYELFNFFITQQEVGHIFDNYRRNRQSFSVRAAAMRTLERYNTKMRDAAKGLGLLVNIYRDFALESGFDFNSEWPSIAKQFYQDNILASGLAFDHFARQVSRPQYGEHHKVANDLVLRSTDDIYSQPGPTVLVVPNGATGYRSDNSPAGPAAIGIGGRPLENALADDKGNDYDSEYTINAGSYYDKAWASMLFTESVDNFISASRQDFLDARYRAVSLADVFPDGYRRWLGNNLTGDDMLKGAWVKANNGTPITDPQKFPSTPLGWTSWWPAEGPQVCFPGEGSTVCSAVGWDPGVFEGESVNVDTLMPIDGQIGWEQQKFLIAWTMNYLPENQQQWWINMLRLWEQGVDGDPEFDARIEFHDPSGKVYVAKTFGTEVLFSGTKYEKTVQKGISARVLQYANDLLQQAYVVDEVDYNNDGTVDWYKARTNSDTTSPNYGAPLVKFDSTIQSSADRCTAADNTGCTCTANRACVKLSRYAEVPFFIRQALAAYGLADPSMKGIYD
ncbi:hypothetical protein [Polyangium sp. 15x6]|uniref:hypothetical protein n=1 Tax=Polyangium sp. 15x6 TaxID=3042687 RepID=UPI00249AEA26|nr:hypothetical protein [Polyangium sp. 15x6]MDI3283329.1 hypothetical protein [Polyangium sp. 15x6]